MKFSCGSVSVQLIKALHVFMNLHVCFKLLVKKFHGLLNLLLLHRYNILRIKNVATRFQMASRFSTYKHSVGLIWKFLTNIG
jgi:hypothetical protein